MEQEEIVTWHERKNIFDIRNYFKVQELDSCAFFCQGNEGDSFLKMKSWIILLKN